MNIQTATHDFIIEQHIRGNTPKTIRYYTLCLGLFSRFVGEDTELSAITPNTLKSYFLHLSDRSITTTTIQTYIRAVRVFLTWCYTEQYIDSDVSRRFRLPKAQRKTVDVLTDSELQQLYGCFNLRYTIHLRNCCICTLMLDSGLRLHEVVTLSLDRLHIDEGYAIVNGKGNRQRVVPLGYHSRRLLLRYLSRRPSSVQGNAVFLQKDLSPVTDNTLQLLFRRLKKQAGIPRLRAHLLRHTFATRYLENGGDLYTLQTILGHTSLEMVKRYVHFTPRKMQSTYVKFSPLDTFADAHVSYRKTS